jgi:hypothetical protein
MKVPTSKAALTKLFAHLGAPDPEDWASSQINEGINQLGRFVFLRQAWRRSVIREGDDTWIDDVTANAARNPGEPCTGAGPALERALAAGVTREDLTEIVRVMQYSTLFDLCYLLEDPGDLELELEGFCWGLYQLDENNEPTEPIVGLHESALSLDPTGREMRPPPAKRR